MLYQLDYDEEAISMRVGIMDQKEYQKGGYILTLAVSSIAYISVITLTCILGVQVVTPGVTMTVAALTTVVNT